jgi:phasin
MGKARPTALKNRSAKEEVMVKAAAGFGNFEIPNEVRNVAEQSVEQARKAFDNFMNATQRATAALEGQAAAAQSGARDVREKAVRFAEQNVANSFDFAQRLLQARDVEEFMRLQTEFVQTQMKTLTEQAQLLGQSMGKAAMDTAKRSE